MRPPISKLFRVELKTGKVYFVKCDFWENDGRRIIFRKSSGVIIRSWPLDKVWGWEEV